MVIRHDRGMPYRGLLDEHRGSGGHPDRSVGWTIRNCVIVDSNEPGTGHSQGLFMGSCDGTVIEGNVFDLNASA